MDRSLPSHPSLDQLRHQAKDLLKLQKSGDPDAIVRFRIHPHLLNASDSSIRDAKLSLSDAQLVIAREYGFASWPKLKAHVEGLERVEERVAFLQTSFAAATPETRERLLSCVHTKARFQHYNPQSETLSEEDARLVIANEAGYAFWSKYESYLYLDLTVQNVIAAVRVGNLKRLREILRATPMAANPLWVRADKQPAEIPNDSIPLFCVSEAVFNGTNRQGNDYEITRALIAAGAEVDLEHGTPLTAAVSYNAPGAVKALLEGGAAVDGTAGDGLPLAYALHFGFTDVAELLAQHHPKLDLRFAAGLGKIDLVKSFFNSDGSLKPDAGSLADPYENRWRCERTRANILSQALYFACLHGRLDVADFLLEQGADVNAEVPGMGPHLDGTVLHALTSIPVGATADPNVIEERRLPTMEFLLKRGANVSIEDARFHSTPLGWAKHHGRKQMLALLASYANTNASR